MVYLPCISVFSSLFNTIHITFSLLYPILFLVFRYNIDFLIKLYNWIKFSSYIILGLFLIRSSTPYISITSTIHSNLFNDQQWFVFSYACLIWTHSSSYHNYIINCFAIKVENSFYLERPPPRINYRRVFFWHYPALFT